MEKCYDRLSGKAAAADYGERTGPTVTQTHLSCERTMGTKWNNLAGIRSKLDKSQSEMAALLGISTRAIQSYEQGWRTVPIHVQRNAAMLLYLNWRKHRKSVKPCWEIQGCPKEYQDCCAAWQYKAGDVCWLVSGTRCGAVQDRSWSAKIARCQKCPVTQPWMTA